MRERVVEWIDNLCSGLADLTQLCISPWRWRVRAALHALRTRLGLTIVRDFEAQCANVEDSCSRQGLSLHAMRSRLGDYDEEMKRNGRNSDDLWRQCQELRADKGQLEDKIDLLQIEGNKLSAMLKDYFAELKAVENASLKAQRPTVVHTHRVARLF